jgi:hypothetical protein
MAIGRFHAIVCRTQDSNQHPAMLLFERNVEVDRLARELAGARTPGENI